MERNNSLESVYKQYINDIYRFLLHLTGHPQTAEDLTQETFYRAYQYLDSYSGEKVKPWLFKVARHTFIDWHRRGKREIPVEPLKIERAAPVNGNTPEHIYLVRENLAEWLAILHRLPDKQKRVLVLSDLQGFTYREIAELLNISLSDVKICLYRGRRKLAEINRRPG